MEKKQIALTDWQRLLAGGTGWEFLLEVFVRAVFTYILLMFAMRLLGKRVSAQLSLFELSMVITLAAAAGVALEVPDRGLLPPIVILAVIIFFQRLVSRWGLNHRLVERITAGDETMLVVDGRILLDAMQNSVLSREKLFGMLRVNEIQHLGMVERVYLESSGDFTVLRALNPSPGLSLIPDCDPELCGKGTVPGYWACSKCGYIEHSELIPAHCCDHCECTDWSMAVVELEDE